MAANRLPYFPFNVDDYLVDDAVQAMDADAEGCYIRVLCKSWKSATPGRVHESMVYKMAEASRLAEQYRIWWDESRVPTRTPPESEITAELVGAERWKDVIGQIQAAFDTTSEPGWWIQKRMVAEARRAKNLVKAQKQGGRNSWEARKVAKVPQSDLEATSRVVRSNREVEVEGDEDKNLSVPISETSAGVAPATRTGTDGSRKRAPDPNGSPPAGAGSLGMTQVGSVVAGIIAGLDVEAPSAAPQPAAAPRPFLPGRGTLTGADLSTAEGTAEERDEQLRRVRESESGGVA